MRAAAVVTGVLGTGVVLVFAVAALVATLFPTGTLVTSTWNGGWGGWGRGGGMVPMPMPVDPVPWEGAAPGDPGILFIDPATGAGADGAPVPLP